MVIFFNFKIALSFSKIALSKRYQTLSKRYTALPLRHNTYLVIPLRFSLLRSLSPDCRHKRKQFRKKKALKRQQALSSDGQVGGVHPEHAPILCQTAFEMNAMVSGCSMSRIDTGVIGSGGIDAGVMGSGGIPVRDVSEHD